MIKEIPDHNLLREAHQHARQELRQEKFKELVANEKARLKAEQSSRRWWHRFIPFTITITITRRKP